MSILRAAFAFSSYSLVFLALALRGVSQEPGNAQVQQPRQQETAPEVPTAVKPQDLQSQTASPSAPEKPDYSKEAFVVEKQEVRYRFENDGTGHKEGLLRVHMLTEAGVQAFGQLRLGYNSANDKLEIKSVRVIKPDGSVVTAGPDAVQDLNAPVLQFAPVYTDYREKHVTVPGLRPGDVLEADIVTVFHTAMAPRQFWMQHDFNRSSIVLDEELEVDVPADRVVKLKNKPEFQPTVTEQNGRRIYRWTSSNLVKEDTEKKSDGEKKKKKKKTDEIADVQMTTFASWEEVGSWYASLEKDRRIPSKEVKAKATELTKGLTSDMDKTQALYDFVAKNFRYVSLSLGTARFQPQSAGDVLRNQYGDCKDKNTLLAALLEAEGLHSSSVLISSYRKLDPDVPSPSQFNHVITMLPMGNEEIWMDTTTEVAPFRLLSYGLRKKQGLVIPPNGASHLEETPADPPMPDTQLEEIQGKVDESGHLDATVTHTLRGDAELRQRIVFRHIAPAQWQKYVESMNKSLGGEVGNIKVSDAAATREPFTISYQISKSNFVDWSKKKLQLKLPLSGVSPVAIGSDVGEEEENSDDANDAESPDKDNFKIGPSNENTYRFKLELASRYHVDVPVPVSLERDYGTYRSTYKVDGNTLEAERKLTIRLGELPPARADDYRAFRRNVLSDSAQFLTLENTVDVHSAPAEMKTADLIRSGNEELRNGNYAVAAELLKRAVDQEPKHKKAWNDLGLAYFANQQDDLAIQAFQKQIEIDAFGESAYNNLGRVYLRERKYEEADKWFSKQAEVDPLDKYAHANLGYSYLEQHRYRDALPELEKAASITPDSANPQIWLGEAYLNLGPDDKALAAFDAALKISGNASTLNGVAYQLAVKGVHLDLARQYAESAVSETSARLRNVSLDRIKRQDMAAVSSLASYWDTLGWVAFAQGKLEEAEKYVAAGWQLSEQGEDGDHLAQIYEKKGDKKEAEHFYTLAMNARRPVPETRGRLAALLGGDDKVDAEVKKYNDELERRRTIAVANTARFDGNADFLLALVPGHGSTATVEDVSYVSGDEKLKGLIQTLRATQLDQGFPNDTPVQIIRRGTVSCKADVGCKLLLALPTDARSID